MEAANTGDAKPKVDDAASSVLTVKLVPQDGGVSEYYFC